MIKKLAAPALLCLILAAAAFATAAFKPPAQPSGFIPTMAVTNEVAPPGPNAVSTYDIQSGSTAQFVVDEVLAGSNNTVVGTSNLVSGQLAVNLDDPSSANVGTILVDARALATDDSQRNRMIANAILSTEQYEFITFSPTSITGLPSAATIGTPYTFQMQGDLTIKDVTRPATFSVTVTPTSSNVLTGSASTTIQYADWGISIPKVPLVASVDDNLQLQLDFVAATS